MAIGTTLKIGFDAAKVRSGLAGIKSQFSGLAKMAGTIAKVSAVFAGVAVAVGATAIKINQIGEDAIASDNKLRQITNQMGLFGDQSKAVADRLLELADAEERMTGTDTIVDTQALLMTFAELAETADEVGGAFDRATMAAVDMAAAGLGTATGNAVQLGKALNDPIKGLTSLSKSGISFTASEKERIAVLVKSNQMGKAQSLILDAIEKQVKGTARATATSSGMMTQSMKQVMEAFAMPFSEGFAGLPGAMESAFGKITAQASQLGRDVGTAISEAVNGDYDRLIAIGELIGSAISEGIWLTTKTAFTDAGMRLVAGVKMQGQTTQERYAELDKMDAGSKYLRQERTSEAIQRLRSQYESRIMTSGGVPSAPSAPSSGQPSPPSIANDPVFDKLMKHVERLGEIEKNTRTGAKM